jgi:hypothetical protein
MKRVDTMLLWKRRTTFLKNALAQVRVCEEAVLGVMASTCTVEKARIIVD